MNWIDLTLGIDENIVTWDNDLPFFRRTTSSINDGDIPVMNHVYI